jgi:hypothetical protein
MDLWVQGLFVGGVQRHYAIRVDSNLRRETNRLLRAHGVKHAITRICALDAAPTAQAKQARSLGARVNFSHETCKLWSEAPFADWFFVHPL